MDDDPNDLLAYAPASQPTTYERQYRELLHQHHTFSKELDVLCADIQLRRYALGLIDRTSRKQVEAWAQTVREAATRVQQKECVEK